MPKYILVVVTTLLVFATFFFVKNTDTEESLKGDGDPSEEAGRLLGVITKSTQKEGFSEYRNAAFRISLQYPSNMQVEEYQEHGDAMTIVFKEEEEEKGFQIFVLPYRESIITEERFLMDVPLGVRKNAVTVMIDGVEATLFESENSLMGATREVWFIKSGYLYEVTTYLQFDTWLAEIMSTWEFL